MIKLVGTKTEHCNKTKRVSWRCNSHSCGLIIKRLVIDSQSFHIHTSMYVFEEGRISTHANPTSTCCMIFHERRISIGQIGQHADHVVSSDFGLLGEQSSPKWEIPCLGKTLQNWMTLALSWAKSVSNRIRFPTGDYRGGPKACVWHAIQVVTARRAAVLAAQVMCARLRTSHRQARQPVTAVWKVSCPI